LKSEVKQIFFVCHYVQFTYALSPTHTPESLLFHLREHASLNDPFIYYSLLFSSAKKHPLHETTTVWCLTKMEVVPQVHFIVAIS
jgi:hypothetical protein